MRDIMDMLPAGEDSSGMALTIEGLDDLREKCQATELLDEPLRTFFTHAALEVEREIKLITPVDTGLLRSSMTHAVDLDTMPTWAQVGTNVGYAKELEFSKKRARTPGTQIPYMRPGLRHATPQVRTLLRELKQNIQDRWASQ